MPAAKLLLAELGLVTAAEAALELEPVPACESVPAGLLPVEPPGEGSAEREGKPSPEGVAASDFPFEVRVDMGAMKWSICGKACCTAASRRSALKGNRVWQKGCRKEVKYSGKRLGPQLVR